MGPTMLFNRDAKRQFKEAGRVSTVGLELGLSIVVGVLGGRWLDEKFGTEPWLLLLGFGFGLAAGARSLYRVARRAQQDLKKPTSRWQQDQALAAHQVERKDENNTP